MPRLAIAELWRRLDQGTIDPFYLFFGQEAYLVREYTETLTARILGAAPRDFNYDRYAMADRDSLAEALGTARTLPVMTMYRVVVVQDLQELRKADWKLLEGYVTSPSESTALIAGSRDSEPKKFPEFVWKHATAVACAPLDGGNLRGWVAKAVTEAGYSIADQAIRGLLQDHDPDLRILEREIEKLCTYVGGPGEVSLEDVQAVGQASRQHSLFALSDALGGLQPGPALLEVDHLLNQGEPPLVVHEHDRAALPPVVDHQATRRPRSGSLPHRQDAAPTAQRVPYPDGAEQVLFCRAIAGIIWGCFGGGFDVQKHEQTPADYPGGVGSPVVRGGLSGLTGERRNLAGEARDAPGSLVPVDNALGGGFAQGANCNGKLGLSGGNVFARDGRGDAPDGGAQGRAQHSVTLIALLVLAVAFYC